MPLVTLSPCIISLQDPDVLLHIALTRPEMPGLPLKIGLVLSAWALAVGLGLVRVWMPGLDKAEVQGSPRQQPPALPQPQLLLVLLLPRWGTAQLCLLPLAEPPAQHRGAAAREGSARYVQCCCGEQDQAHEGHSTALLARTAGWGSLPAGPTQQRHCDRV